MAEFQTKPAQVEDGIPAQFHAEFGDGEYHLIQPYRDWLTVHGLDPMLPWPWGGSQGWSVSCWVFDDDVIFAHKIAWE